MARVGRRLVVTAAAWTAGAAAALLVSQLALSLIGTGLADRPVQVLDAAAGPAGTAPHRPAPGGASTATGPARSSGGSGRPGTAPDPPVRVLTSPAGSVVASCVPQGAYLLSWAPAPGFAAGAVDRGPADAATNSFRSGKTTTTLVVGCHDGVPELEAPEHTGTHREH